MNNQTVKVLSAKATRSEKTVVIEAGKSYGGSTMEAIALRVYLKSKNDINIATKNCVFKVKKIFRKLEGALVYIQYVVFQGTTQIGSEVVSML